MSFNSLSVSTRPFQPPAALFIASRPALDSLGVLFGRVDLYSYGHYLALFDVEGLQGD